jgi:hypothetical protein
MGDPEHDLFTPSLEGERRQQLPEGSRPWRLASQFYVAALGGPVAAGLVGVLNGRRLGIPGRQLALIAGVAVVALACAVVIAAAVNRDDNSPVRLVLVAAGVVAYLAIRQVQVDADRRYAAGSARNEDEAYDSLWIWGIGMVVGGGIVAGLVLAAVTG